MGVGVLMPAFNEASKIGGLLAVMPESIHGREVTLIVVDDGSTDGTGAIAEDHGAVVVKSQENGGKGSALRLGMEQARGYNFEALVWMDSDGQHRPESLSMLVSPVLLGTAGMAVGSRYLNDSSMRAPFNRRLVRRATIRAIRGISGCQLTDPFSGFRCFSRQALDVIELRGNGYESELEACFAVARAGLEVVEIPIPRIYGPDTSKMGHRHGDFLGRLVVVGGYARTVFNAWMSDGKEKRARIRV